MLFAMSTVPVRTVCTVLFINELSYEHSGNLIVSE
jgi:hypothetical protein